MPQVKRVQTIEQAGVTSKGTDYWKVTWEDGKSDNIFNNEHYATLLKAKQDGKSVSVTKEQKGKYWNITELKITDESPSEAVQSKSTPSGESKPGRVAVEDKRNENIRENMEWKDKQIREMLWLKEIGENFRTGFFDRHNPKHRPYLLFYSACMQRDCDIKIEKES